MKMKKGFTLAEVLIALALVGVITAITLPMVMTNHHYKTVGVKLAKFANQVETAALPYVAAAGAFSDEKSVSDFIDETFMITETTAGKIVVETTASNAAAQSKFGNNLQELEPEIAYFPDTEKSMKDVFDELSKQNLDKVMLVLKDGTAISVNMLASEDYKNHAGVVNKYKVGAPKFAITFYPNIPSLPSFVQKNFDFTVTELGYVYPSDADDCLWAIFNSDYVTTAHTFNEGSVCVAGSSGSSSGTISGGSENSNRYNQLRNILDEQVTRNYSSFGG